MTSHRLAILTSSFPPQTGGIASAHFNLFKRLSRRHEVRAYTYRDNKRDAAEGVVHGKAFPGTKPVCRLAIRKLLRRPLRDSTLPQCDAIAETAGNVMSLNRSIAQFDPDIIICPDNYVPALLLRKPANAKLIWMARNNYLRFVDQSLVPPRNVDDFLLAHRLERRAVRKADAVVSPSKYMLGVFEKSFDHHVPMRVARNFVDEDQLKRVQKSDLKQQLGLAESDPLLYVPSGGIPMKGVRYLYEIARALRCTGGRAGVYVSGTVPNDVRWELDQLGPEIKCFLPGHVAYEQNLSHVAACDLTVSPTLIENLSNALVESILLGVPVVTFDTGGNKEIVRSDETGHIVPYADIDALTKTIRELVTQEACLERLQQACREHGSAVVDLQVIDNVYETLFSELLSDRAAKVGTTTQNATLTASQD